MNKLMAVILAFGILCSHSVFAEVNEKITIAIGEIEYRAKDSSENKKDTVLMASVHGRILELLSTLLTTALVQNQKIQSY